MDADLKRLIQIHGPESVLEALSPMASEKRVCRIKNVLNNRLESIVLCLEELYDPLNGAAVIRTAESMGIQNLLFVSGERGRFSAAKAVTIGAHKWLELQNGKSIERATSCLREKGYINIATSPRGDLAIDELDVSKPLALWFGNERDGISTTLFKHVDQCVKIPMFGFSESFNISISAALCLQELCKRRREHLKKDGDLSEEKKLFLKALWLAKGIRGSAQIIERYVSNHGT